MSMSLDTWAPLVYQCLTNVVAHGYNRACSLDCLPEYKLIPLKKKHLDGWGHTTTMR
jgi:hypothetical protein